MLDYTDNGFLWTWDFLGKWVRENRNAHQELYILKSVVELPEDADFAKSVGLGKSGAMAHWRRPEHDGPELHIVEYKDHYELHWDKSSWLRNPIAHALDDAPVLTFFGTVAAVAIVSAIFGASSNR